MRFVLELSGTEVRKQPFEERKSILADLLKKVKGGIEHNEQFAEAGLTILEHACKLGHEEILDLFRKFAFGASEN